MKRDFRWISCLLARSVFFTFMGAMGFGLSGAICLAIASSLAIFMYVGLTFPWNVGEIAFGILGVAFGSLILGFCAGAAAGGLTMFLATLLGPPDVKEISLDPFILFGAGVRSMAFFTLGICLSLSLLCGFAALFGSKSGVENFLAYQTPIVYCVTGVMVFGLVFGVTQGFRKWKIEYAKFRDAH